MTGGKPSPPWSAPAPRTRETGAWRGGARARWPSRALSGCHAVARHQRATPALCDRDPPRVVTYPKHETRPPRSLPWPTMRHAETARTATCKSESEGTSSPRASGRPSASGAATTSPTTRRSRSASTSATSSSSSAPPNAGPWSTGSPGTSRTGSSPTPTALAVSVALRGRWIDSAVAGPRGFDETARSRCLPGVGGARKESGYGAGRQQASVRDVQGVEWAARVGGRQGARQVLGQSQMPDHREDPASSRRVQLLVSMARRARALAAVSSGNSGRVASRRPGRDGGPPRTPRR